MGEFTDFAEMGHRAVNVSASLGLHTGNMFWYSQTGTLRLWGI